MPPVLTSILQDFYTFTHIPAAICNEGGQCIFRIPVRDCPYADTCPLASDCRQLSFSLPEELGIRGVFVLGPFSTSPRDVQTHPYVPPFAQRQLKDLFRGVVAFHICHTPEKCTVSNAYVRRILEQIHMRFEEDLRLTEFSEIFHISPSYLSRTFKKETQLSFTEYLISYRLERSCAFLSYHTYSLLEIALQVGFNSQSYYSRLFRRKYGMTPTQYRRKHASVSGKG